MRTRKYIVSLLTAGALLFGGTSCDDWLDIKPEGEILAEDALNTIEDLFFLLNSCYDVAGDQFYDGRGQFLSDLLADDIDGSTLSGDEDEVYNRRSSFFNGTTNSFYSQPYISIFRCNTLLDKLAGDVSSISGLTPELADQLKGEALFLRGLSHFEVARLYAFPYGYTAGNTHDGVPIYLQAQKTQNLRSTVAQVYAQSVKDLKEASSLLGVEPVLERNGETVHDGRAFATKAAAYAMLARVFFQAGPGAAIDDGGANYQQAFDFADLAIQTSNSFAEFDEILYDGENKASRFLQETDLSKEAIWGVVSDGTGQQNRGENFTNKYRSDANINAGTFRMSPDLELSGALSPNDKRSINYRTQDGQIFLTKFDGDWVSVPVLHLSEMYLIRAETAARVGGDLAQAADDLNLIVSRASTIGNTFTSQDPQVIIDRAVNERRLELVGEGHRYHDLRRRGAQGEITTIRNSPWDCNGLVLQFPVNELTPEFTRNPEGGCE